MSARRQLVQMALKNIESEAQSVSEEHSNKSSRGRQLVQMALKNIESEAQSVSEEHSNKSSRGQQLVQMALKNIESEAQSMSEEHSNKSSRGRQLVQMALKNIESEAQSVSEEHSNKYHVNYRIQGSCVSNTDTESALICDEELTPIDAQDHNQSCANTLDVHNANNTSFDEDKSRAESVATDYGDASDDCYDLDDSVRDPDWIIDKSKGRKRYISTSSSDSEDTNFCKGKPKARKRKGKHSAESDVTYTTEIQTVNNKSKEEIHNVQSESNIIDERNEIHHDQEVIAESNITDDEHIEIDHEEEVITTYNTSNEQQTGKKPRARKGMGNPDNWNKNVQKKLRMEGKTYTGVKKVNGKKTYSANRCERIQGERDCGNRCKRIRNCFDISEDTRQQVFDAFWNNMDWNEKKIYVASLVNRCEVNSKASCDNSRRKFTFKYHLRNGEKKVPVCKNFFLSTLGIGEYTVYEWMNSVDDHGLALGNDTEIPRRKNHESTESEHAKQFLQSLPKMPSHYCRSTSTKEYLEPLFASFSDVYRTYKEECSSSGNIAVGRKLFQKIFDTMNISIFRPKKDQCDVCVGHETQNVSDEIYTTHIKRKEEARSEKDKDKARALNNDKVKVVTMDVQSVLLCPSVQASAIYYKTKLACHNFTVYDLASKHVTCYFWHEGEGGLQATSFSSCINDYIESILKPGIEEIVIYSDGCGYQNRNVTLSNTLLRIAETHSIRIIHNYLEKGHTQMEVDSVHSTIERVIKKRPIYSPSNYVECMQQARPSQPYVVKYLEHGFFRDFGSLKYYESIRPGHKVGDPVVTDVRSFRYAPSGDIEYKLHFDEEYQALPKRKRIPAGNDEVPLLYDKPLSIKATKYEHLQQLKCVIPKDYHTFYDGLSRTK